MKAWASFTVFMTGTTVRCPPSARSPHTELDGPYITTHFECSCNRDPCHVKGRESPPGTECQAALSIEMQIRVGSPSLLPPLWRLGTSASESVDLDQRRVSRLHAAGGDGRYTASLWVARRCQRKVGVLCEASAAVVAVPFSCLRLHARQGNANPVLRQEGLEIE